MYAAVDVGGTKTLVAVFDENGTITEEIKFPTNQNYDDFLKDLAATVAKLTTSSFKRAAVAVPSSVDRQQGLGLVFGNLAWSDVPIMGDSARILGCPVIIENDANLAGLSEAHLISNLYRKVYYLTVSTGIGGGYVVEGKLDPDTINAEVGKQVFQHEGKEVTWESFASGKAIVAKYGKQASEITDTNAWDDIAHNLSIGIYNIIMSYTPEVIVVGGGVGGHLDKFKHLLEEKLKSYNPSLNFPPILQAQRPNEAVVYGCYELAKAQE